MLPLWCDAAALGYWILFPEEHTPEKLKEQRARADVPPGAFDNEDPVTGRPFSRLDKFFPLLMAAVKVEGKMILMAWAEMMHIRELLGVIKAVRKIC
jgi:hypothetical protein